MKWRGSSKYPPEQERIRRMVMAEADRDFKYRKALQFIKDKMDLFGEEKLTAEELALVGKHHGFFYPDQK